MIRNPSYTRLQAALEKGILVLDGAMGTMIQKQGLSESDFLLPGRGNHSVPLKGNYDVLVLTRPDLILKIHNAYIEAGANVLETNTFNANSISQSEYGLEAYVYEINKTAADLAREAAGGKAFVLGSMGPTNRTASMSPDVEDPGFRNITFDQLVAAYREQVSGLLDGGVDQCESCHICYSG
jgi:5-methyltetrahydrofolate--homocysteine methyltransferase